MKPLFLVRERTLNSLLEISDLEYRKSTEYEKELAGSEFYERFSQERCLKWLAQVVLFFDKDRDLNGWIYYREVRLRKAMEKYCSVFEGSCLVSWFKSSRVPVFVGSLTRQTSR